MATTHPPQGRHHVYQVRSGLGEDPTEILTRLTHQVWQAFEDRRGGHPLDPHLWPEIFKTFRNVFSHRLSFHPQCGHFDYCWDIPCVLCGQKAHTHPSLKRVYLLETRQSLEGFLKAVADALARRLHRRGVPAQRDGKALDEALRSCVAETLKTHFFISDLCRTCPARESLSDRRVWAREQFEAPWGRWRDIFSEEVNRGLVLE